MKYTIEEILQMQEGQTVFSRAIVRFINNFGIGARKGQEKGKKKSC